MKEDKHNFEIPYAEINKVEMKKPGLVVGSKLHFYTSSKDYLFYIKAKKAFNSHVNLVSSVLSDKLSVS